MKDVCTGRYSSAVDSETGSPIFDVSLPAPERWGVHSDSECLVPRSLEALDEIHRHLSVFIYIKLAPTKSIRSWNVGVGETIRKRMEVR